MNLMYQICTRYVPNMYQYGPYVPNMYQICTNMYQICTNISPEVREKYVPICTNMYQNMYKYVPNPKSCTDDEQSKSAFQMTIQASTTLVKLGTESVCPWRPGGHCTLSRNANGGGFQPTHRPTRTQGTASCLTTLAILFLWHILPWTFSFG